MELAKMKDSLFVKVCLVIIIVLLGLNLLFHGRYDMKAVGRVVLKIDRLTGRVWKVTAGTDVLLSPDQAAKDQKGPTETTEPKSSRNVGEQPDFSAFLENPHTGEQTVEYLNAKLDSLERLVQEQKAELHSARQGAGRN